MYWGWTSDFCWWEGVSCDSDKNVITLLYRGDESGTRLVGGLPSVLSLRGLPKLQTLDLQRNDLSSTVPAAYSHLGLVSLWLHHMPGIVGTLPRQWAGRPLAESIQFIGIGNCSLVGTLPDNWSVMQKLEMVTFSENALTGTLPSSWGNMTSLTGVWLYTNNFSGTLPPEYQAWSRLEHLQLWRNPRISGTLPEAWGKGLRNLTEMGLGGLSDLCLGERSVMTGTLPPAWSGLIRLKKLNVICMPNLSGSLPAEWGALKELEVSHVLLLEVHSSYSCTQPSSDARIPLVLLRTHELECDNTHLLIVLAAGERGMCWFAFACSDKATKTTREGCIVKGSACGHRAIQMT